MGRWDGRKHLLSTRTMTFPTGLLTLVKEVLDFHSIAYAVQDTRPILTLGQPMPFSVKLYGWQEQIVKTSIEKRYGIIKSPTGSGKGTIMHATVAAINQPTVILVTKQDLLWQLAARWKEYTETEAGIIGAGRVDIKHVNIAMVQTVARTLDPKYKRESSEEKDDTAVSNPQLVKQLIQTVPVVLLDESHHSPARTIYNILKNCKSTTIRLGYSATPFRDENDDLMIEAALGTKIVNIGIPWLVQNKYLAEPTIYFIKFKHKRAPAGLTYKELYANEIVENEERNKLIVKLAYKYYKAGKKVMIAVTYIKHGNILEQMLRTLVGDDVRFVSGQINSTDRKGLPEEFEAGTFKIAIATTCWGEGLNLPSVDVLINAKGGESKVATLQIAGRALRITATKTKALVLDVLDTGCRFFQKHAKSRIEALQSEGLEVKFVDQSKV